MITQDLPRARIGGSLPRLLFEVYTSARSLYIIKYDTGVTYYQVRIIPGTKSVSSWERLKYLLELIVFWAVFGIFNFPSYSNTVTTRRPHDISLYP